MNIECQMIYREFYKCPKVNVQDYCINHIHTKNVVYPNKLCKQRSDDKGFNTD